MRGVARRPVDAVRRLPIVRILGEEDVRDIGLRVPIDDREPRALYLDHDAMAFTIQSPSLPVVAANRCATIGPRTVTSASSDSVSQLSTSGRLWTNRWSCSSHVYHPDPFG